MDSELEGLYVVLERRVRGFLAAESGTVAEAEDMDGVYKILTALTAYRAVRDTAQCCNTCLFTDDEYLGYCNKHKINVGHRAYGMVSCPAWGSREEAT